LCTRPSRMEMTWAQVRRQEARALELSRHARRCSPAGAAAGTEASCLLLGAGTSWRPGRASLVWLEGALQALDSELRERYGPGAGIVYCRGPYLEELRRVADAAGAGAVYYSRRHEPAQTVRSPPRSTTLLCRRCSGSGPRPSKFPCATAPKLCRHGAGHG
jgi:deoxyribodipyrimidine photolyase